MVYKVSHKELKTLIKVNYEKKIALFVWGTFGIGKSQEFRETAKVLAKEKGREFIEWNKITKKKKQEIYEYPEKYFVLVDIRLSEYDSSDIKGLPYWKNDGTEFIEWRSPFFAKLLAKDGSDGILLFDEINLSTPIVVSSCYKIIYDRIINDEKVSKNWLIVGCGNLDSDRAFTHTLPAPLKDRGSECELIIPNVEDWTTDFAIPNGIDSRIIGYINFKKSSLHKVDFNDNQKFVTPRGWERVSNLIKGVKDWNILELACKSAIGEGIAHEFISFCKISEKMKLEEVIKNPQKIKGIKGIDIKFFLVSALAERYSDKKVNFEKIMEASKVLDEVKNAELVSLMWRLCSSYTQQFKSDFLKSKDSKFIEKYGKYII